MECCISPTDQMALLDVARLNQAIEIVPASTQSVQPLLEVNVLSVATGVEDTLLPVETSHNTGISERPAPIDTLLQQCEKVNELSVATTSEHSTMSLYGATHDKSVTEPINRYPTAQIDIDQDTLLVATKTNLSDEKFLLQQQEKTPLLTDKNAAKRTSLPHLWEHTDPEPELPVATLSQDADDTCEQCPETDMDITHII